MNNLRALCLLFFGLPCFLSAQQRGNTQQIFERFDKNEDGKLSAEEVPSVRLFERLDTDQDGFVSVEESKALGAGRDRNEPSMKQSDPDTSENGEFEPREHGQEAVDAQLDPEILARLDIAMETAVSNKEVSGVVGLIHRNGRRGYFEAFGWQEIESEKPMPRDAIFRLQSMSKPVVTAAALALYDAGEFDLDESIANHLPEWTEPTVLEEGELVPAKTKITPRMLMSHSSGLYYGSLPGYSAPRGRPANLEEHSQALAKRPLKFHPGEGNSYGTSIDVLGRYCEAVAGKPLDEIVRELILVPLKMTDTDFWVRAENADRIVQIYRQPESGVLSKGRDASRLTERPTLFLGGQGLCSTAVDYERFCLMLLNGGELEGVRILKEETVDEMFKNQLEGIGERYGLGAAVDGEGGYAWGGANGTQFWIDRSNNFVGIFMIQAERYRAPTFNTFRDLAVQAVSEKPAQPPTKTGIEVGSAVDPNIRWNRSLQLPHLDPDGAKLTGTEVMELATHKGVLYAGNSHWNAESDGPTQVFALTAPDRPWELDFELPEEFTRTTYLKSVTFRSNAEGKAIEPRSVLILGVNRKRVRDGQTPAVVWVRDDENGHWIENTVGMSDTEKWAVGVRSIGFHRDRVTGADMVFLGVGPGAGIFSGTYDAAEPGGIRWNEEPEFRPIQSQRIMDFAVCDGTLFAATQRVLYRRVEDGPTPRWETVLEKRPTGDLIEKYSDGLHSGWAKYDHFRAMGVVGESGGPDELLLFGSLNRIFRLDPTSGSIEPEVDIRTLFREQLGLEIHYAQTQHYDQLSLPRRGQIALIGLEVMFEDDFIEQNPEVPSSYVRDRHAGKRVHWARQGFYLERHAEPDGTPRYYVREIFDPNHDPQPDWLARVRSIRKSPFPEEKENVIYASGFSPWGLDLRVMDTGWIYRGEFGKAIRSEPSSEVSTLSEGL